MESVSLQNIFEKHKETLRDKLKAKRVPRDLVQIQSEVQFLFTEILTTDSDFRDQLIDADIQLLNSVIRMCNSSYSVSLNEKIDFLNLSRHTEKVILPECANRSKMLLQDTLTLFPTLLSSFITPWLTIPIAGVTVGVKNYVIKQTVPVRINVVESEIDDSQEITEDLVEHIICALDKLFKEIDSIVALAQENRKEIKSNYEEQLAKCTLDKMYPQLLETLRYLWKENNALGSRRMVEEFIKDFEAYGYIIVEFNSGNRRYFSFNENPKVIDEVMYLPAIVRKEPNGKEEIIEKGIVYIPSKKTIQNETNN